MSRNPEHEQNRKSWNEVTPAHNRHKGDQAAFFRDGGSTLFSDEKEMLGDVRGKRVLHLQCNCGQDTLSIAAMGVAEIVGVDISDEAVTFAQKLASDAGMEHIASFVRSDLFDWFESQEPESFDVVFTTYGTICWLSDLKAWGKGIGKVLKPQGRFVMVEFHPTLWLFGDDMEIAYPYSTGGIGLDESGINDYVQDSQLIAPAPGAKRDPAPFVNPHRTFQYAWGLGETIQVLIDAGIHLDNIKEFTYSNGCKIHPKCVDIGQKKFSMPSNIPPIPLMFAIAAHKN